MGSQVDDENRSGDPAERVLGYLNFSSGSHDPQFHGALDTLFAASASLSNDGPAWKATLVELGRLLDELATSSPTFSDAGQAKRILALADSLGDAYGEYHSDLLGHLSPNELINSFLLGRMFECLLAAGDGSAEATISAALGSLNDYVGYRPVATLASKKIEPYPHEWLRPLPVYLSGAGAATGKYRAIINGCVDLLTQTDPALLRAACFDPTHMDELAIDPRAYDFEHPASKRPNHQFGMWDPHCIDGDGFYRRFVIQQLTIDGLIKRIEEPHGLPEDEVLFESSAVLAGTVLMSSGISGYGPETHDSTVRLGQLLMRIAGYRDEFYLQLIARMKGSHGARLQKEAKQLQQPFGGARQSLNRELTRCRAIQLQRVHLARIYARMDYTDAAAEQTKLIQVPAARLNCEIDCGLTVAKRLFANGDLEASLAEIVKAQDVLDRGIDCGAIVDPWNILGFDANFSLFGQIENSIRDFRVDDLIDAVEETLELCAQVWSKAVAAENEAVAAEAKQKFHDFANWWHQFAAHELDSVDAENPLEVYEAASNVVDALSAWREQGEASGDIGFWAPHVQKFDSCRAYWLVINTLLLRDDKVASLGLMMHWLSQADRIPLEQGETSFFQLTLRWLAATLEETGTVPEADQRTGWKRIRRFFDYLEANLGEYEHVPVFQPDSDTPTTSEPKLEDVPQEELSEDDDDDRFQAAYENVVYKDSTDDGKDGSVFDFEPSPNEDYLQQRSRTILSYTTFIDQYTTIWKMISVIWSTSVANEEPDAVDSEISGSMTDLLQSALSGLDRTSKELEQLIQSLQNYRLSRMGTDPESMVEYDRLRLMKESLIEQVITAQVSVIEGLQFLSAATGKDIWEGENAKLQPVLLLRACMQGDPDAARAAWKQVEEAFRFVPILYVPLNRGGDPKTIAETKSRQQIIQNFMLWMPRLGLLTETFRLVELVRAMEASPVGQGAITEFDSLFEVACRSLVMALVDSYESQSGEPDDEWLVSSVEALTEPLLRCWLDHSRTLRLSVIEQVGDDEAWKELVTFIREYGREIFTQRFLSLGNIRGILHQGVDNWLEHVANYSDDEQFEKLLQALEDANDDDFDALVDKFSFVLEAVVENYSEYRDYNSTTTQSDQGNLLFSLMDFLRLRVSYDRVVWNLNPIIIAHQVLSERRCEEAAQLWRNGLQKRIGGEAKRHITNLKELQKKYAMSLPSIAKRISEQFMRPLLIDHNCSLIQPAISDTDETIRNNAFQRIKEQSEIFLNEPSGAGLEVPAWLIAMEDMLRTLQTEQKTSLQELMEKRMKPAVTLSIDEIQSQIGDWTKDDDK